ncbi:hypothetical protein T492DRAFT_107986 [Pavlovales sp. CCMP2436]|nr:hypothetical protein T492DRAFT_107986 [Pavlovales sp. CCMP2436]|mmetsp:Transcript_44560/g.110450  ORF Transcript_44560/g.110450 Transcript_44560/m.110450 type:complete len:198 (+) Transcript_44560:397-990(+)
MTSFNLFTAPLHEEGTNDAMSKKMAMPAFRPYYVGKDSIERAIVAEKLEIDYKDYIVLQLLESGNFHLPRQRASALKVQAMFSESSNLTLSAVLIKLGVTIVKVVVRVGSWNIRASLEFHCINRMVLASKAARVRKCVDDEQWDAFALQEAPSKLEEMTWLVEALKLKFDDKWEFQAASTSSHPTGDGCVFRFCTSR